MILVHLAPSMLSMVFVLVKLSELLITFSNFPTQVIIFFLLHRCHSFMKEHCPDYCEDFSSSKYKCADHPDIDCEAVKASGLCDDLSKSM